MVVFVCLVEVRLVVDKVVEIEVEPPNEAVAAMLEIMRHEATYATFMNTVARIKKAQYDALVVKGFTEEEAMSLIKPGIEL